MPAIDSVEGMTSSMPFSASALVTTSTFLTTAAAYFVFVVQTSCSPSCKQRRLTALFDSRCDVWRET